MWKQNAASNKTWPLPLQKTQEIKVQTWFHLPSWPLWSQWTALSTWVHTADSLSMYSKVWMCCCFHPAVAVLHSLCALWQNIEEEHSCVWTIKHYQLSDSLCSGSRSSGTNTHVGLLFSSILQDGSVSQWLIWTAVFVFQLLGCVLWSFVLHAHRAFTAAFMHISEASLTVVSSDFCW